MKVGDLVVLSAYGRQRDYNARILLTGVDQVGIIIKANINYSFPYKVLWSRVQAAPGYQSRMAPQHSRRELKYARR